MPNREGWKQGLVALVLSAATACVWAAGYPLRIEAVADEDGVWQVMAHNRGPAPVFVQMELTKTENIRLGLTTKGVGKVLEPGAREPLAEAIPIEPTEKVAFEWDLKWVFGRGTGKGNHDGLYRPPFPGDMTFDTTNTASDHPAREKHAIDILMPPGTPVIAARTGWVMDVSGEEGGDRVEDGLQPVYITPRDIERMGGYIRVMHDDGTWAEYSGLQPGSIKVTPGVKVEAGTQIGTSGERFGAEPHITFAVMKSQGGLNDPESLPFKMEMAGRGVVAVVAGTAIGASLSVAPTAQVTKADPLVIAQVEKGRVNEGVGVLAIKDSIAKDPTLALGIAGVVMACGIGFGWRFASQRKGDRSWKEWAASSRSGRGKQESAAEMTADESEEAMFAAARMKDDMRPASGMLIAEWEAGIYSALALAMRPGYQVFPKISMNRLFARPTNWLMWPEAHSQMRGESIDYAVVRLRDNRIVAALDIERSVVKQIWSGKVDEMREECFKRCGIKHVKLTGEEGPDELRRLIEDATKDEGGAVRTLRVAA